jgi:sortase A
VYQVRLWHGELGALANINHALNKQPIILAGHRDSHMQFMYDLNIGDKIELMMSDRSIQTYIITKAGITNKPALEIPVNLNKENSLILTTCWPEKASKQGPHRYIIFSKQIASKV